MVLFELDRAGKKVTAKTRAYCRGCERAALPTFRRGSCAIALRRKLPSATTRTTCARTRRYVWTSSTRPGLFYTARNKAAHSPAGPGCEENDCATYRAIKTPRFFGLPLAGAGRVVSRASARSSRSRRARSRLSRLSRLSRASRAFVGCGVCLAAGQKRVVVVAAAVAGGQGHGARLYRRLLESAASRSPSSAEHAPSRSALTLWSSA